MKFGSYIRSLVSAATVAAAFLVAMSFAGCGDDSELQTKEEETILKFLTSKNYVEDEDYTVIDGVYRIITGSVFDDMEDPEDPDAVVPPPANLPIIAARDEAAFFYVLYIFTGTGDSGAGPWIYTNDTGIIEQIKNLNSEYWSKDPMRVTVGNGDVIKGIDVALSGCRLGDYITLIIPSRMGYGGEQIGNIGKDKMLLCQLVITEVNGETPFDYGYVPPPPAEEE